MGKLFIVGIGPGDKRYMTCEAGQALERCDTIFGFGTYLDLIRDEFPDKKYIATGMGSEIERCRAALEYALQDKAVAAIISGGDAGIYGMAGPVEELWPEYEKVDIEVIPGISAAISGAAVLGAPLMNDFCVISLSDHLTQWELIEKRLKAACEGDLVTVIYNPMSAHRRDNLKKACEILLLGKDKDTPCGWVKNIGRQGMEKRYLTLDALKDEELDMFTTVFVGNSFTVMTGGRMVTKRGYGGKMQ